MKPVNACMVWLGALVLVQSALVQTALGQSELFHEQVGYAYDLQRFTPAEYAGHAQNLATVQDRRGIVYVANRSGLLEYDSATWRRLRMPNGEGAFSLALSDSGVVYVGGKGEIGYLAPDSVGVMRVVSLMDQVPEDKRNFLYVWGVHETSRGVYFHTGNRILRWDGRAFLTWESERRLRKPGQQATTSRTRQQESEGPCAVQSREVVGQVSVNACLVVGPVAPTSARRAGLKLLEHKGGGQSRRGGSRRCRSGRFRVCA